MFEREQMARGFARSARGSWPSMRLWRPGFWTRSRVFDGVALAVAAMVAAVRPGARERRWWAAGGACAALAVLSHAGSVPIVGLVLAVAAFSAMLRAPRRPLTEWARVVAPGAGVAALAALYWVV